MRIYSSQRTASRRRKATTRSSRRTSCELFLSHFNYDNTEFDQHTNGHSSSIGTVKKINGKRQQQAKSRKGVFISFSVIACSSADRNQEHR